MKSKKISTSDGKSIKTLFYNETSSQAFYEWGKDPINNYIPPMVGFWNARTGQLAFSLNSIAHEDVAKLYGLITYQNQRAILHKDWIPLTMTTKVSEPQKLKIFCYSDLRTDVSRQLRLLFFSSAEKILKTRFKKVIVL
jgi:hypothetical protein